jgi:endoglucanase
MLSAHTDHTPIDTVIAVDATHAVDTPEAKKTKYGENTLEGGPVIVRGSFLSEEVVDGLVEVADELDHKYQLEACGNCVASDIDWLPFVRPEVRMGLLAIPGRYMHTTVETFSTKVVDQTEEILVKYIKTR